MQGAESSPHETSLETPVHSTAYGAGSQAIEVYASSQAGKSGDAPIYVVNVDFASQGDALPDGQGIQAGATAQTYILNSNLPSDGHEPDELETSLQKVITRGWISDLEWHDAVCATTSTHPCDNPYCVLAQVATRRVRLFCNSREPAMRHQPLFASHGTASSTNFWVRLIAPVCPMIPSEETLQENPHSHDPSKPLAAFSNVRLLSDRMEPPIRVVVTPRFKPGQSGPVVGQPLIEFDWALDARVEGGQGTESDSAVAAKDFIRSALVGRCLIRQEWDEVVATTASRSAPEATLSQCVARFLRDHCSDRQRETNVGRCPPPEMTVFVALSESPQNP